MKIILFYEYDINILRVLNKNTIESTIENFQDNSVN